MNQSSIFFFKEGIQFRLSIADLPAVSAILGTRIIRRRVLHLQLRLFRERRPARGRLPPLVVDAGVHDDPVQPRSQLRVVAKAVERSIDLDEHVLRNVLGIVMVAGELIRESIHQRAMPLDERMERSAVTGRRAGYEVRIGRRAEAAVHCQEYDVERRRTVDRLAVADCTPGASSTRYTV